MARPQKATVNYFSHDAFASEGRTLTILFNNFGHEGISAWWLLLEKVSSTNNHIISISNPEDIEFLAAKLHFKPERLQEILKKLAELGAIDEECFKHGFIWSDNFIDRVRAVYATRKQEIPRKPSFNGSNNPVSLTSNPVNKTESTQRKGKEIKGKEIYIPLPPWIDKNIWNDFLEMRRVIKAIPTERAKDLLVKELEKLKEAGDDPNEILKRSIINNWKGLFPLKDRQNSAPQVNRRDNQSGNQGAAPSPHLYIKDPGEEAKLKGIKDDKANKITSA